MPQDHSRGPDLTSDRDPDAPRQLNLTQRESEVLLGVERGLENKTRTVAPPRPFLPAVTHMNASSRPLR